MKKEGELYETEIVNRWNYGRSTSRLARRSSYAARTFEVPERKYLIFQNSETSALEPLLKKRDPFNHCRPVLWPSRRLSLV